MQYYTSLSIMLLLFIFTFSGCRRSLNEPGEAYTKAGPLQEEAYSASPDTTYEPAVSIAKKQGQLINNGDTLEIVVIYTDDIAYTQKAGNNDEGVLLYREAIVNIINRNRDTLKIRKTDFQKYIPKEAYGLMILQGTATDMELNGNVSPFMIWFCQPDSDFCYWFDVKIQDKKLEIKEVDEGEMVE